jgi:TDG/mug DNA glycosylase family protein
LILPDYLAEDLAIIFVGTAASDISATKGHYYANPANRFWQLIDQAGFTDHLLSPSEDRSITRYGLGLTDVVKTQHSGDDTRLLAEHIVAGRQPLRQKLQQYAPKLVCFTSKNAFHAYFGYRAQSFGLQAESLGSSRVFITPSPSPRVPASRTFNGMTRLTWFRKLHAIAETV